MKLPIVTLERFALIALAGNGPFLHRGELVVGGNNAPLHSISPAAKDHSSAWHSSS